MHVYYSLRILTLEETTKKVVIQRMVKEEMFLNLIFLSLFQMEDD